MSKLFSLSPSEQELMQILWAAGEPLGRQEILDRAAARSDSWAPSCFHVFINSLLKKGAVVVAGFYQNGRKVGRNYYPAISKEGYAADRVRKALEESAAFLGYEPFWLTRCKHDLPTE